MTTIASKEYLRSLLGAVAVGLVVAPASIAFIAVNHRLTHWLWHDLPHAMGQDEPATWLVLALPAVGGLLTAMAFLLPGRGGHSPLEGLMGNAPVTMETLPSALLAALASLAFGAVLGPEAPLMAIGGALGLWLAQRFAAAPDARQRWMLGGILVALATILGNPLNSVILVAEILAVTTTVHLFRHMLPALVAAGVGYLFFVGVGPFVGIEGQSLAIPGLEAANSVSLAEIAMAPVIGLLVGGMSLFIMLSARRLGASVADVSPWVLLPVGGLLIGGLAVALGALTDFDATELLFSGQTEMDRLLATGAVGGLFAYLVLKACAFITSAVVGFRGGVVFPLVAVAVATGTLVADLIPGVSANAGAAAAIAAALAGGLRLPFTGVLFAVLLLGPAGNVMTPVAIFASASAYFFVELAERERARRSSRLE